MRESSGEEKKGGDATARRAYLGKLRTHLERSKVNPRTSIIGTAVIKLMVGADGMLISHQVSKSSGSKVLDEAAMASIEKASPFPPIPADVGQDRIEFSVPFKFTVR
jgi:protein TonB